MLRRLILVFLAFWLPVQAGAALASTLAADLASPPAHGRAHDMTDHDHEAMHGHAAHLDGAGTIGHEGHDHGPSGGCERCGLCQFVHGGVMLNAGASLPALIPSLVFPRLGDERFTAHIPELLQRPPLSAA